MSIARAIVDFSLATAYSATSFSDVPTLWVLYVASCDEARRPEGPRTEAKLVAVVTQWHILVEQLRAVGLALRGLTRLWAPVSGTGRCLGARSKST